MNTNTLPIRPRSAQQAGTVKPEVSGQKSVVRSDEPARKVSLQPPCPAGVHLARCSGWVDLGMQVNRFAADKKPSRRVLITWTIRGSAGETWRVSREYAWCAGTRAALRKLLEEWRGRPYASDDEAWAVLRDPRRVLEKACLVRIEHRPRGEGAGVWTEVAGVWPLMKGQAVESLRWPPTLYVPGMAQAEEVRRGLPEWVRRKMGFNASDHPTAS